MAFEGAVSAGREEGKGRGRERGQGGRPRGGTGGTLLSVGCGAAISRAQSAGRLSLDGCSPLSPCLSPSLT